MHQQGRHPIRIGQLQRHAIDAFHASGEGLITAPPGTRRVRVACIGAGPASLACAAELCRQGARATILERHPLPGGLNTYGVAEYKLRAAESLREIELVQRMGVEFRFGASIDSCDDLRALEASSTSSSSASASAPCSSSASPAKIEGVINALELIAGYKTAQIPSSPGPSSSSAPATPPSTPPTPPAGSARKRLSALSPRRERNGCL